MSEEMWLLHWPEPRCRRSCEVGGRNGPIRSQHPTTLPSAYYRVQITNRTLYTSIQIHYYNFQTSSLISIVTSRYRHGLVPPYPVHWDHHQSTATDIKVQYSQETHRWETTSKYKGLSFRHEVTNRAENRNLNQLLNNYLVKIPIESLMENYRILPLMSKDNLSINAVRTFNETAEKRRKMDICI